MAKYRYDNESISSLKGADRVRKRPGVIFGSDGLEGCEHSVFEILSNSIDEAREGHGNIIKITRYIDNSIEIEDQGRGIPVDYNSKEEKFNWDVKYVDKITFLGDWKIILATVKTVIKRDGISAAGEATMSEFMGSEKTV